MPIKGKLPEWEKEENRKKIFFTLLEEPLSFTKLLNTLSISRRTLSEHLKDLEKEKIIVRTRRNDKRVYQVIFDDKEKIMNELKSTHFDLLLKTLSHFTDPLIIELWRSYSESILKGIVYFKEREVMQHTRARALRLSAKEIMIKSFEIMKTTASPKLQQLMHIDEILESLEKIPESEFDELEQLRRSIEKELKEGKKDEVEN